MRVERAFVGWVSLIRPLKAKTKVKVRGRSVP